MNERQSDQSKPQHPSNRPEPDQLKTLFTYHPPTQAQAVAYASIRRQAVELGHIILSHCPPCADTTAALRKLRETVMTANAAIALDPAAAGAEVPGPAPMDVDENVEAAETVAVG